MDQAMRNLSVLCLGLGLSLSVYSSEVVELDATKVNAESEYTRYEFQCDFQSRLQVTQTKEGGRVQESHQSGQTFSTRSFDPIAKVIANSCAQCRRQAKAKCQLESVFNGPKTCQVSTLDFYNSKKRKWETYDVDVVALFENIDLSCPLEGKVRLGEKAKVILITPQAYEERIAAAKALAEKPAVSAAQTAPATEPEPMPEKIVASDTIPLEPVIPLPRVGSKRRPEVASAPFGPPVSPFPFPYQPPAYGPFGPFGPPANTLPRPPYIPGAFPFGQGTQESGRYYYQRTTPGYSGPR